MDHQVVKKAFEDIKVTLGQYWVHTEDKDEQRIQKLVNDPKWERKSEVMANAIDGIEKAMRRAQAAWENPTLKLEDKTKMMNIFVQRVLELKEFQNPVKIATVKKLQKQMLNG